MYGSTSPKSFLFIRIVIGFAIGIAVLDTQSFGIDLAKILTSTLTKIFDRNFCWANDHQNSVPCRCTITEHYLRPYHSNQWQTLIMFQFDNTAYTIKYRAIYIYYISTGNFQFIKCTVTLIMPHVGFLSFNMAYTYLVCICEFCPAYRQTNYECEH